jgi:hypothetical protein
MSVDAIMERLTAAAQEAMEQAGEDINADIVEMISVPVGRSGGRVIRSQPGEPPRKETGGLIAAQRVRVLSEAAADVVTLTIQNQSRVANWLERGTSKMSPRPFYSVAFSRWQQLVPLRVAATMRASSSNV